MRKGQEEEEYGAHTVASVSSPGKGGIVNDGGSA